MAFEGRTYMMASDLSEQFLRRPYCTSHLPKILQSTANATSVYPTCPEGAPIPNSRIHFLERARKARSFGRIPASQAEMEGPVHRSGPRRCEGEIVKVIQCRNSPLGLWPLGVVLVFELLSGLLAIECPIDRDAISVGSPVPGAGFRPENPDLAESALPQTLLGKEADLQFRLIQPTSVYRRVVNGEPIPQRPTLFLAEAVRQRLLGVGTQVVHDQMDGLRRGIAVGDGLDEVCKFQRRPGRGDLRKVNSCLRFDAAEYIGSSSTFVFIVALGHAARFHGQGFSDIVVKSHRLFIYAHHRLFGRQRPFIDFQHIFP